jgi:hypothetical protein
MTINARRTTANLAVAGAAALTAAIFGLACDPAAHADTPDPFLSDDAAASFMTLSISDAVAGRVLPSAYESLLDQQTAIGQNAVNALSDAEAIQSTAINNGDLDGVGGYLYGQADAYFANAANELGAAVSALEATPNDAINVYIGDFEVESATNDLNFLDQVAPYLGIGDTSSAVAGAADAASTGTALTEPLAAAATGNADDPASFVYSADPTNIFSPVYSIAPTGAENVISTDASGDVVGTQEFTVSELGFPVDTFTGGVEYSPGDPSNPLALLFGNPYVEDVSTLGASGTLIPDNTGFLVTQFGGGYGFELEEANITGTSPVVGDFLTTPFGPENVTNFVNEFLNFAGSVTGTASAADPSSLVDLLASIGL